MYVMIKIGITKEFDLALSITMRSQLENALGPGAIYYDFTDTGVLFSIKIPEFIRYIARTQFERGDYGILGYYKYRLVIGQHKPISSEFFIKDFIWRATGDIIIINPYASSMGYDSPVVRVDSNMSVFYINKRGGQDISAIRTRLQEMGFKLSDIVTIEEIKK